MTKRTSLICDHCKKEEYASMAIGWKRINITGVDNTSFSDPVFPADLCSPKCIVEYISKPLRVSAPLLPSE